MLKKLINADKLANVRKQSTCMEESQNEQEKKKKERKGKKRETDIETETGRERGGTYTHT